jgi:23S rRNA (pseudouridine1915-N3)-methyltransferase
LKIVLLVVGKLRDKNVAALCDDYVVRARRHLPIEVVEVEDDRALARRWPAQGEGETIALEPGGDSWTTERFAQWLDERMTRGTRSLTFAIGGADGLPRALVARASSQLSLSPFTLPHRLARLILSEQIYRALTIIRHEPYHH